MPWLSIIMALVSFFLAGGSDPEKRGKAAAIALGVGAATYGITHYTDWGRGTLGQWDGVEFETLPDGTTVAVDGGGNVTKPVVPVGGGTTTVSGSTGLWGRIGGFLSTTGGQIAAITAAASIGGVPGWVVIGGGLLAAYTILKD